MEEIAGVNEADQGEITVSGHTDDVPLIFGSQFRDNWDPRPRALPASSRRSRIQARCLPAACRLSASGIQPVGRTTPRGRATNRRIEIEINY